jgi:UPF0755 protein
LTDRPPPPEGRPRAGGPRAAGNRRPAPPASRRSGARPGLDPRTRDTFGGGHLEPPSARGRATAGPARARQQPSVSPPPATTPPPGGTRRERREAATRRGRAGATTGDAAQRERSRGRRRGLRVVLVLCLIALPFVLAVGWFGYQLRPGSSGPEVKVHVTRAMGTGDVADTLARRGVIDSALAFKVYATVTGAGPFEAGTYVLHEGQGIRGAIRTLDAGPPRVVIPDRKLLLPPGLTMEQIAERVGKLPGKSAQRFLDVVRSGSIRSKYQPADQTSLEGLLFPDTYFIGAHESEESIVRRLVARFDEIADKVGLETAEGLTPYQAVVAASLIQTEAKLAEDAPLISAVIRNRIAAGQPLQIDSTLCYARLQTTGTGCPPPPTESDKAIDSPYNTYKVVGLPPTPIASVTEAMLQAALHPADVPYRYYVIADANGKHAFATTLQEHERNVAAARAKGLL